MRLEILELYPSRREGFEKSNAGRPVTFPIFSMRFPVD